MAFKTSKSAGASLESPEALFNDLRSRTVQGLLAHQADMLREYAKTAQDKSDVAIQMPTGSGKTLVGLLVAEWRRRKFNNSAVYLCPTNQLVKQVARQGNSQYGVRVLPFTGKKTDYDPKAVAEYQAGEAIAVTSYSSLFNVKPFFDAPKTIVLDDAHSAENYIASLWSVRVERLNKKHKPLFDSIVDLIGPHLAGPDVRRLTNEADDDWDAYWVDKLPTPVLSEVADALASILDTYSADKDLKFSWSLLRPHLYACHLYLSTYEILLRPLIPPTFEHPAFRDAEQRLYMSATLGEGGDLERTSGRKAIHRLKGPPEWEKQGIGRRYFIFAERSLDSVAAQQAYLDLVQIAGRALFLVPSDAAAEGVRDWISRTIKYRLFSARDIEDSKHGFVNDPHAVAVAANRYDGIDLPNEECRFLVVQGLPGTVNLQERFLVTRMGAARVLDDRILTRIVQAFGRCTRSATDYAAVAVSGEQLNKYIMRTDRRQFFHPELQAELQFGIDQAKDSTSIEFAENLSLFLSQGDQWRAADAEIVRLRSGLAMRALPGSQELRNAVTAEVRYTQSLWSGNFDDALNEARSVLGNLGGDELKGYRAFWYYLAGSAAWLAFRHGAAKMEVVAREMFDNARRATTGVAWLYALARTGTSRLSDEIDSVDPHVVWQLERIEQHFIELGTLNNRRYDEYERSVREGLESTDASTFEIAQQKLGRLLGYESGRNTDQGAPDPWWLAGEDFCLVFEDHSEAIDSATVSVKKARQVNSHPNWIRENVRLGPNAVIYPVLITDAKFAAKGAVPHLRDVYFWPLDAFRLWARDSLQLIRRLRSKFVEPGDLEWRSEASIAVVDARVGAASLANLIASRARAADALIVRESA